MRIQVDLSLCTGHGRCYALCPRHFDEDDAGHCVLLQPIVEPSALESVRQAVDNCPEGAIRLVEDGDAAPA